MTSSTSHRTPGSLWVNGRPDRRAQTGCRCAPAGTRDMRRARPEIARFRCAPTPPGLVRMGLAPQAVDLARLEAGCSSILVLQRVEAVSTTAMPSTALSRMAWVFSSALRVSSTLRFGAISMSRSCPARVWIGGLGDQLRPHHGAVLARHFHFGLERLADREQGWRRFSAYTSSDGYSARPAGLALRWRRSRTCRQSRG